MFLVRISPFAILNGSKIGVIILFFFSVNFSIFAQTKTIILGRPTDKSVTASILFDKKVDFYLEFGTQKGVYSSKTAVLTNTANTPNEVDMQGLAANTRYYYRLQYRLSGATNYTPTPEYTFITQRPVGAAFTFAVESDEHLYDKKGVRSIYKLTLQNQLKEQPDFMLSLGDIFGDDHTPTTTTSKDVDDLHKDYLQYLGEVCHSMPFFVCLGNHEGENGYYLKQTPPNNIGVYGTLWRKFYYPNPIPNSFYTGNVNKEAYGMDLPANYYAWTWGDATFIVLDVYRHCDVNEKPQNWDSTLGKTQYDWLKKTLTESKSKYKFLFAHQLIGGGGTEARGGTEVAHLFELGGKNADGSYRFNINRPNWGKPVHELSKEYNATIFFHGHDHFYGKQDKEGIVYQEVPQPSVRNISSVTGLEYGYIDGVLLASRGFLMVTVSPENVKVEYVKIFLPTEENNIRKNMDVAHSYTITPNVVTGLKEIAEKEYVKIYPNTAKDYVKVEFLKKMTNYKIRLANMKGQVVSETYENDEIDVRNLPNGVYLLNIVNEKYQFNRKIVVSH